MKDILQWETTFDGRQPSMENTLQWNTTFDGRQPWMEDDLGGKMTLDGRRPWMEDMFRQIGNYFAGHVPQIRKLVGRTVPPNSFPLLFYHKNGDACKNQT